MTQNVIARRESAIRTLRRLARRQPQVEHCEFCNSPLGSGHRHLLEVETRRIVCACNPCALRFENVVGRWKLIPRESVRLRGFELNDAAWDEFALPINLAFFFRSTPANRVIAMYPSPAGATESLLSLRAWEALAGANPCLKRMQSDVEALLVNRIGNAREYYLVPIDRCFELVGTIRVHWRGLSGGPTVWKEIDDFFGKHKASAVDSSANGREAEVVRA